MLHGKGDAGAFNEGDWQALPEKVRAQLRVFARSPADRARPDRVPQRPRAGARAPVARTSCWRSTTTRPGAQRSPRPPASRASSALTPAERPGGARLGRRAAAPRAPLMRTSGIGTRYAVYVAALALALVAVALVAAGAIALGRMRVRAGGAARRGHGGPRGRRRARARRGRALPGPAPVQPALPARRRAAQRGDPADPGVAAGRLVPGRRPRRPRPDRRHAPTNPRYGERVAGRAAGRRRRPDAVRRGDETELRFRVAAGGVSAGWGIVTLSEPPWQASLRRLEEERTAELWQRATAPRCSRSARSCCAPRSAWACSRACCSRARSRGRSPR